MGGAEGVSGRYCCKQRLRLLLFLSAQCMWINLVVGGVMISVHCCSSTRLLVFGQPAVRVYKYSECTLCTAYICGILLCVSVCVRVCGYFLRAYSLAPHHFLGGLPSEGTHSHPDSSSSSCSFHPPLPPKQFAPPMQCTPRRHARTHRTNPSSQ